MLFQKFLATVLICFGVSNAAQASQLTLEEIESKFKDMGERLAKLESANFPIWSCALNCAFADDPKFTFNVSRSGKTAGEAFRNTTQYCEDRITYSKQHRFLVVVRYRGAKVDFDKSVPATMRNSCLKN